MNVDPSASSQAVGQQKIETVPSDISMLPVSVIHSAMSEHQRSAEVIQLGSHIAPKPVILQLVTEPQQQIWAVGPPVNTAVQRPLPLTTNFIIHPPANISSSPVANRSEASGKGQRRRSAGNGLRQFAEDVLRKVERKGVTTYNEVADELVTDMCRSSAGELLVCEEKNIRRRVYDALNVLLAMKIITKDKKLIRWAGMPASQAEQRSRLEKQKRDLQRRVNEKKHELNELIIQQVAFGNLVERNKQSEDSVASSGEDKVKLRLPFIVVNTRKRTSVDCWMSSNRDTYVFSFDDRFEMHDDVEVLKRCGLAVGLESGKCHGADLERALKLVGINLRPYIIDMAVKNHMQVLGQPLSSPASSNSATSSIAINDADDEDSGKKDLDTIVISKTLQDATAAENTSSMTAETNADGAEDASSDDMGSESDESQEANSEDSDVDAN